MNPEHERILRLIHLPGRFNAEQAAAYLGFQAHEIPILVSARLLKPSGRPAVTGVKYFSLKQLERLRADERWYDRASDAIIAYWREKNRRRKKNDDPGSSPAEAA